MGDLFKGRHDPGGKVKTALPPGMGSSAIMSPCRRYRHLLSRFWGDPETAETALWIGMNPSTADADFNDPTITREIGFTQRLTGCRRYIKANIMDYRCTDPKGLLAPGVEPRSPNNLSMICEHAVKARIVVCAWGIPPKPVRHYAGRTIEALRAVGVDLWCLGKTAEGWPRHPLYLRGDTLLERL